ncbi:type ISP restriction/modification enzyme [Dietzia cercidiphylli]|uniref:type ISP restriction/modification enzyme n=1 Tax=Dietzia cercidiphylli TaxID=498199 RepID=UPI0035CD2BD5
MSPTRASAPLDQYQTVKAEFEQHNRSAAKLTDADLTQYLQDNPQHTAEGKISWNHSLKQQVVRGAQIDWSDDFVYPSTYRPFNTQWVYRDARLNDRQYQLASMFPTCQAPGFVEGGYLASTRSSTGSGDGTTAACCASYSAGGT